MYKRKEIFNIGGRRYRRLFWGYRNFKRGGTIKQGYEEADLWKRRKKEAVSIK